MRPVALGTLPIELGCAWSPWHALLFPLEFTARSMAPLRPIRCETGSREGARRGRTPFAALVLVSAAR
jgi:hypothetical protein